MLVTPPFGASSNIALWRAYSKPPVELVVADLEMSEIKISASSKFNNSVILFICLLSEVFRCRIIIRKETEKGKKSNDFLPCLNIYRDPTECPR